MPKVGTVVVSELEEFAGWTDDYMAKSYRPVGRFGSVGELHKDSKLVIAVYRVTHIETIVVSEHPLIHFVIGTNTYLHYHPYERDRVEKRIDEFQYYHSKEAFICTYCGRVASDSTRETCLHCSDL